MRLGLARPKRLSRAGPSYQHSVRKQVLEVGVMDHQFEQLAITRVFALASLVNHGPK